MERECEGGNLDRDLAEKKKQKKIWNGWPANRSRFYKKQAL